MVAKERGQDIGVLMRAMLQNGLSAELKKEHPLFCGGCRDHGLLDLRCKAVQRRRKLREDDQEHGGAKRARNDQEHRSLAKPKAQEHTA